AALGARGCAVGEQAAGVGGTRGVVGDGRAYRDGRTGSVYAGEGLGPVGLGLARQHTRKEASWDGACTWAHECDAGDVLNRVGIGVLGDECGAYGDTREAQSKNMAACLILVGIGKARILILAGIGIADRGSKHNPTRNRSGAAGTRDLVTKGQGEHGSDARDVAHGRAAFLCAVGIGEVRLQFTGDSRLWWNAYWGMRPGEKAGCTWEMLKELIRENYYPTYYRAEMERQFLSLQQGTRTVDEYEREFTRLAAF
ncbi:Unknown protein, partial [Striga hermonthica]